MMDFGFYYDPAAKADVGLIREGFWDEPPPGCSIVSTGTGADVYYTCHHYGAFNSEAADRVVHRDRDRPDPARALLRAAWRTFPADSCDWSWSDHGGIGEWRVPRRAGLGGRVRLPRLLRRAHWGGRCSKPDAGSVRTRGAVGTGLLGSQPPIVRPRADRARPSRGRVRLLGVRRRAIRRAATASTAST